MTPRLETIEEIFHAALDQEPDKRSTFLDKKCAGDEVLRHKVEALLASHQEAGSFIETPVASLAASIVENGQTDLLIGQTIGHYKISKRIGAGGMGEVYLASDITAGRKAALKILPIRFTGDAERLKRFQQEARAVVGLNHPNILTVYEIGADSSTHYIASELIEGETLRQRLSRGRMELSEAVEISIQVAGALAAAHEAGIIHRDVKPENIMLRPDGYVKVLDFGIAKLAEQDVPVTIPKEEALLLVETNLGSILGTVRYMSPEQARGGSVDKRTDIWSLGAVLYELATGRAPFAGGAPKEVMATILTTEPPPLSRYVAQVPGELQQIVSKALRKAPGERYPTANEMLDALKGLRRKLELKAELERSAAARLWLRWTRSPAALALTLLAGAFSLAFLLYWLRTPAISAAPAKSIAVLPFENLSREPDNAFFTNGVQDEILTALARIADLKVISRTSVTEYKSGIARDLREIGQQLGVAHVLEGSVQRSGNRVRVNAQLVDTRTDAHLWAQSYDRDLADVFAIESDIATTIANQLQAKLSVSEQNAIAEPPTTDVTAFLLYNRAKSLLVSTTMSTGLEQKFRQAIDLLNQAVARDPSFFLAYCQLAYIHDRLYFLNIDHTPARLALAKTAIDRAFRLRPNAGEAHLAHSEHLYRGDLDYDGALAELDIARRTLPNDARIFELAGFIKARQGKFEEALHHRESALQLDPRNLFAAQKVALINGLLRRYADEAAILHRCLVIDPNDVDSRVARARLDLEWKADPRPLHEFIDSIRTESPSALPTVADSWFAYALAERDVSAAEAALESLGESSFGNDAVQLTRAFGEGLIGRMTKDEAKARSAFELARAEQEKRVRAQPNYGPAICVLGLIDAGLGRKEDALSEGRRAIELLPVKKDAIDGVHMIEHFAIVAAWSGEKDLACEQLAIATRLPGYVSYGQLKLLPYWDPLRGDPRFEKIVASLAPK
jgi:TolB-like protein/Tfp pilus assembly protein PilF